MKEYLWVDGEPSEDDTVQEWLRAAFNLVEPENRDEFLNYITTGEASATYKAHLNGCIQCQKADYIVFERQTNAFETFARLLHRDCQGPCPQNCNLHPTKLTLTLTKILAYILWSSALIIAIFAGFWLLWFE